MSNDFVALENACREFSSRKAYSLRAFLFESIAFDANKVRFCDVFSWEMKLWKAFSKEAAADRRALRMFLLWKTLTEGTRDTLVAWRATEMSVSF